MFYGDMNEEKGEARDESLERRSRIRVSEIVKIKCDY